jgi:hypothetical protein
VRITVEEREGAALHTFSLSVRKKLEWNFQPQAHTSEERAMKAVGGWRSAKVTYREG